MELVLPLSRPRWQSRIFCRRIWFSLSILASLSFSGLAFSLEVLLHLCPDLRAVHLTSDLLLLLPSLPPSLSDSETMRSSTLSWVDILRPRETVINWGREQQVLLDHDKGLLVQDHAMTVFSLDV